MRSMNAHLEHENTDEGTNRTVILAIYIITFLIGLPANLLSLYTFLVKVHKKAALIDILLIGLTFSDILLLIFLPLKMVEAAQNKWPFHSELCTFTSCIFHSCIYVSILLLTTISMDRYLRVAFPIKYRMKQKAAYAVVANIFIWLLVNSHCSMVVHVSSLSNTNKNNNETSRVCYKNFSDDQKKFIYPFRLELCLVLFCVPFIITAFCYISVIRILASLPNISACKKHRVMGLALVTLLNYTLCFGPFNISHIIGFKNKEDPKWREYSFALSSFNTCLDPLIFFFSSTTIPQNVSVCWAGINRKVRPILSYCSLLCCKEPRDNNEGAGTVALSTSSGVGGTGIAT